MTVNSRVIKTFLQWSPDAVDVPLMNGLRIQILPTIEDLPRARKHQFAAFIASDALLVVWDDEALHLIQRAKAIESELMELVWRTGDSEEVEEGQAKKGGQVTEVEIDSESGEIIPEKRPTHLLNTILVGFTLILIVTVLGAGFREIAIEIAVDHDFTRLAFLALTPVQIFFTLVSFLQVYWSTRLEFSHADTSIVSSSVKSLWVVLLNALVPSARCIATRSTTPRKAHRGYRTVPFLILLSNVLFTRKVWHLSLRPRSGPLNRRSRRTNSKVAPRTCSLTTTVFKLLTKRSDVHVSNSTLTTPSDGPLVPSMVLMGSYERANSRRYVVNLPIQLLCASFGVSLPPDALVLPYWVWSAIAGWTERADLWAVDVRLTLRHRGVQ